MGLTSGSARSLSRGSGRTLRRPADNRLASRFAGRLDSMPVGEEEIFELLRESGGRSLLTTMNSSFSKLGGMMLVAMFLKLASRVESAKNDVSRGS
jgi:hypothetical protein